MDVAPPPKRRQRVSRGRFRGKDLSFLIPPRVFHLGARVKSISEIEKYFYGTKRIMSMERRSRSFRSFEFDSNYEFCRPASTLLAMGRGLRSTFFKRALDTSDVAREEKLKIGSNFRKSMDIVSVNNYCHRYRPFINSGRVLGNFDVKTRIGFLNERNARRVEITRKNSKLCRATHRTRLYVRSFPFINFKLSYAYRILCKLLSSPFVRAKIPNQRE